MHDTKLHDDTPSCDRCGHAHLEGTPCKVCTDWTRRGGRMACGPEVACA